VTYESRKEQAEQILALTLLDISVLRHAAARQQSITHEKHIDHHYRDAIDVLEKKAVSDRAYLARF